MFTTEVRLSYHTCSLWTKFLTTCCHSMVLFFQVFDTPIDSARTSLPLACWPVCRSVGRSVGLIIFLEQVVSSFNPFSTGTG